MTVEIRSAELRKWIAGIEQADDAARLPSTHQVYHVCEWGYEDAHSVEVITFLVHATSSARPRRVSTRRRSRLTVFAVTALISCRRSASVSSEFFFLRGYDRRDNGMAECDRSGTARVVNAANSSCAVVGRSPR